MDFVLDSPLNRAHQHSRRADKLTQKGFFHEALEEHEQAIKNLQDALKETENNLVLESLELQQQYHQKKQEILRIKKKQVLALKQAASVMSEVNRKAPSDESLKTAIYRTFEEADSLIDLLGQKKETEPPETSQTSTVTGSKKPKDDAVVIEELHFVNSQLRNLIDQLMTELANSERQVATLRKRIIELEAESMKNSKIERLVSTPDEFSVDLPPLELPKFDNL